MEAVREKETNGEQKYATLYDDMNSYAPDIFELADMASLDEDKLLEFLAYEADRVRRYAAAGLPAEVKRVAEHVRASVISEDIVDEVFRHDQLVIATGDKAANLFDLLQREGTDMSTSLSIGFRRIKSLLKGPTFTWGDHVRLRPTFRQYLNAGISATDLRACRAANTYADLRDDFDFMPDDLTVNRRLFATSHLRLLFNVDWKTLLVDFCVGPEDYLLVMKLPLEDLCTLNLDVDTMVQWQWRRVFEERGKEPPGIRSDDPRIASMRASLDRALFVQCTHYTPRDWNQYLGVDYVVLSEQIGLDAEDPWSMWGGRYFETLEKMAAFLGFLGDLYDPDNPFPFVVPSARGKGKRKHRHRRHRRDKQRKRRDKTSRSLSSEEPEPTGSRAKRTSSSSSSSSGNIDLFGFASYDRKGSSTSEEEDSEQEEERVRAPRHGHGKHRKKRKEDRSHDKKTHVAPPRGMRVLE